ncbi:MAG: xenobiotic-transporting ATPase [Thalassobius sp.]|nr:xenobiotic-transporting ATPase [Thalassovita sp.]
MNSKQFNPIIQRMAGLVDHDFKMVNLRDEYYTNTSFTGRAEVFLDGLSDKGRKINLAIMKNNLPFEQFILFVEEVGFPVLTFYRDTEDVMPVMLYKEHNNYFSAYLYKNAEEIKIEDASFIFQNLEMLPNGEVLYAVPFSQHALVSEDDNLMKEVKGPVSRLFNLLGAERKDIFYIYFYAIIISIISLSLPLGVQSIIEMISGGVFFNSIILLISFVIIGVLIAGALQVMQYSIVEVLQRRIFVKAAFEFSHRIPKVKAESILNDYAPELMNRFFDVLTLQKGLPKLLIDLTGAALQIVFGLVLLSFYHPFFIFFSIILLTAITLVFYFTGPKGLDSSLIESKYKYKVAHWLEEIARTLYSFKLAGHTNLPLQKMDSYVNNYLHYRKKHFRILMAQFINIIGFKTIVTGGLLIIGSWLVMEREITLGQFVATEIVIVMILAAVEKLILNMSTVYDMLTAVEKIGNVTDLGLEKNGGITIPEKQHYGLNIRMRNVKYKYPGNSEYSINGIDLDIKPGERVCISGYNSSGKNTMARLFSGVLDSYEGMISLNGVSMRDVNLNHLRDQVAKNVSSEEIFDGTILENVTMGNSKVSYEDVTWALESVGLLDLFSSLPNGLMTNMVAGGRIFSQSVASKLVLARCIAERPRLLILNDIIKDLEKVDRLKILHFLMDKENPWTLVSVSNDPMTMASCDRIVLLDSGKKIMEGTYEELMENEKFKEILVYKYTKSEVA